MKQKMWMRLIFVFIIAAFVSALAVSTSAQETPTIVEEVAAEGVLTAEAVQTNLDATWILLAGFLVFFMQAGFAMLEGGFIRQNGVVNSLAENFMDACITGIMFFIIGYGIAFAGNAATSPVIPAPQLALGGITGTAEGDGAIFVAFFFQFAFAGAAATIATGAMAERTNFIGKLIYSAVVGAIIYPIVVFWTWGGGWLAQAGFLDFAGSSIVHQTGGVVALVGAYFVGPRLGRKFGSPPPPSNLTIAALGTFILWFGWYGFNVGSTLSAGDVDVMGLVVVNTTLAACVGAIAAMVFNYFQTEKWDLSVIINGSLAGLVGITAGCAFVAPLAAIVIGMLAGVTMVLAIKLLERIEIDDAVGAFAVHGVCGMLGTLAVGFWGLPELTDGAAGLLMGGGVDLLLVQLVGIVAITAWVGLTSTVMFAALKAANVLRIPSSAEREGIDSHEHGADAYVLTALADS